MAGGHWSSAWVPTIVSARAGRLINHAAHMTFPVVRLRVILSVRDRAGRRLQSMTAFSRFISYRPDREPLSLRKSYSLPARPRSWPLASCP